MSYNNQQDSPMPGGHQNPLNTSVGLTSGKLIGKNYILGIAL